MDIRSSEEFWNDYFADCSRQERIHKAYIAVSRFSEWCCSIDTSVSSYPLTDALVHYNDAYKQWQDAMAIPQ